MCVLRENLVNKEKESRQQAHASLAQLFRKVSKSITFYTKFW